MTTLEDDLRETLRNGDRVVPPGFADHILRRVRRQQTRRRRAAAGVAVLALLGGAAGLAGGWVGGASFVSLVPAESNECGGVSVRALGAGTSGGGTRNLAVLLTNTSEDVCRVSPDLTVALLVGERRLDVAQLAPVRDRGLVDLSGGEAALSIELVWDNWCLGQVRAARVHLSLPGGSGLTTEPFQPSPTCRDNEAPSTVRVFQLGLGDVATAPSAPPVPEQSGDRLRAALGYRAALENWVACLKEQGVTATGPDLDFTVSVAAGPARLKKLEALCPPVPPSAAAGYNADELADALPDSPAAQPTPFPTNAAGLTYGSGAGTPGGKVEPGDVPDLVRVSSDDGTVGYVYGYELEGATGGWVSTREQALETMKSPQEPQTLTVYERDGKTPVGTFTVGG